MKDTPVDDAWCIPDEVWVAIEPLLPRRRSSPKGGRPRMPDRQAMDAIVSVLRTGCQWKARPRSVGASSTVSDRFRAWTRAGVFEQRWRAGVLVYDPQVGIAWEGHAMDGALTQAPLGGGGKGTGAHPTDRGKRGVTRSRLTEGRGMRLAVAVDGANRHDRKLVAPMVQAMVIERPPPTAAQPQHLCLDKRGTTPPTCGRW